MCLESKMIGPSGKQTRMLQGQSLHHTRTAWKYSCETTPLGKGSISFPLCKGKGEP